MLEAVMGAFQQRSDNMNNNGSDQMHWLEVYLSMEGDCVRIGVAKKPSWFTINTLVFELAVTVAVVAGLRFTALGQAPWG